MPAGTGGAIGTKAVHLLWGQKELRAVIAELQEGQWQPTAAAHRSSGPQ